MRNIRDIFQSESMLAYIVINQYFAILQTPISQYCNTLQSPSLQIAIYLHCKVQLTGSHYLKGVRQIGNSLPQAPKFLAPTSPDGLKINETQ